MLKLFAKFLKVLNSDSEPGQISLSLCFAMIAGLTPLTSLHNLLILFLVCILRANLSTFLLGLLGFTGIAYLLDPIFNQVGLVILTATVLNPLWSTMYNLTIFRLANFNNSIVMGSLALSLLLSVPIYFMANLLINNYRDHLLVWVRKSRLMKFLMASKLYGVYKNLSELGGVV